MVVVTIPAPGYLYIFQEACASGGCQLRSPRFRREHRLRPAGRAAVALWRPSGRDEARLTAFLSPVPLLDDLELPDRTGRAAPSAADACALRDRIAGRMAMGAQIFRVVVDRDGG